ncbi:catechol 2,3-dioxygenase-like lactoylglutathione lyase family enzyme [Evansella vedderi]|uniref:Catechol 2,3-dioxygenase-like lactoylglutathione lyase family enzyme n=1 Tax=Evansella vedderi TaxID=38282 RepID=A0ABT9ZY49_9BACI|nr:VOC family protein [Evansella vedderi]MDQ0255774.1 catechol 2,3-dioxygenase-like lactoylglutathione lyase family enzyme [Evansella vedderi]
MEYSFNKIDHVQLAAPEGSENTARDFFSRILGFKEIDKPEQLRKRGGVWFCSGTIQIHIGVEEPFSPAKKAHPALEVTNIEALKTHLRKNQVEFKEDNKLPNVNRMYIHDPFGNRIEILEWRK